MTRHNCSIVANSLVVHYSSLSPLLLVAEKVCPKKFCFCKVRLLLVAEVTRCEISLVVRSKVCSLFFAEIAGSKKSLFTLAEFARYSLLKFHFVKDHFLFVVKFARCTLQKLLVVKNCYSFAEILKIQIFPIFLFSVLK